MLTTDLLGTAFIPSITCWQALSSPISGVLGDKLDRTHIVSFGCFLWGVMTAGIGMAKSLSEVIPKP
jgi:hypothetical protein